MDAIFPVGSIYLSMGAFDPNGAFPGIWVLLEAGRFLLAAGSGYAPGSTGGTADVALTWDQLGGGGTDMRWTPEIIYRPTSP